ncbi:glycosyl transferase [Luteimicrobium album]|uniref:Glycosyl transferase n=1 Tax=Luteimicrobium album TaxID=1054550 RepID=A0ABQ6I2T1_9MICO|nr:glycosyltransferase [Luteimicrobium album]GMA25078.1 glycosyl transferase [Luteimicrobium album]
MEAVPARVVAVVVAYNRRDLLAAALDAIAAQTRPLDHVVVVDNASTDDSLTIAREHPSAPEVLALARNTGGAGGFAAGLAHAVAPSDGAAPADLVWLMDDDTIPTPTALAELLVARDAFEAAGGEPVAVAGSKAVWTDGREHPMNTPRRRPRADQDEVRRAHVAGAVPVRSSSFVSMLVDARAVREDGLPAADYFIWNDDFEFSTRLLRHRPGLYVPASVVEHRTAKFAGTDVDPGPRFYNEVRNKVWMFSRSRALGPVDTAAYGASTLVRWGRTVARSQDRRTLLASGWKGLRDGVASAPRPADAVLEGLGPVEAEARAVEAAAGRPVAGGRA